MTYAEGNNKINLLSDVLHVTLSQETWQTDFGTICWMKTHDVIFITHHRWLNISSIHSSCLGVYLNGVWLSKRYQDDKYSVKSSQSFMWSQLSIWEPLSTSELKFHPVLRLTPHLTPGYLKHFTENPQETFLWILLFYHFCSLSFIFCMFLLLCF